MDISNPVNPALHQQEVMHTESNWVSSLHGKDIVIVGLQPWYFETGCNAKNIAQLLAENNRVLYVNFALKRKSFHAKKPDQKIESHIQIIKDKQPKIRQLGKNLWEYYPTLNRGS